jgi:undecaprenyl-diphosphatase
MIEHITLGIVQGVAEWLPISSEGMIVLVKAWFFPDASGIEALISNALFLHLGTFLAALIYFRQDVLKIFLSIFNWKTAEKSDRNIVSFLFISTAISGAVGFALLKMLVGIEEKIALWGAGVTFVVGVLLLVTGVLQLVASKGSKRTEIDIKPQDSVILGLVQGFAILPGLSRSGLTVSALLLDKFNEETTLRLSFLMSLPIVLAGNIVLNLDAINNFDPDRIIGLLFAFLFGYLTIDILLKVARKVNFGWFVIIFGTLSIIASFVG